MSFVHYLHVQLLLLDACTSTSVYDIVYAWDANWFWTTQRFGRVCLAGKPDKGMPYLKP